MARRNHTIYINSLNQLVDVLFEEAFSRQLTWSVLAKQSGLSYSTVKNLGTRKTKYPQYRTVQLLAHSLGGKVAFSKGNLGHRQPIAWTPKVFAA